MINTYNTDAVAWLRAWRHRCCPPEHILHGTMSTELTRHLELCPWCRNDLERGHSGFNILDDLVTGDSGPEPAPCQLWSLSINLGGWGLKNRYYNPPLVLIIDQPDSQALNVVQVYDDRVFCGPDDIPLDNECAGFSQPWNRYTVRKTDLGFYFGSVTDRFLEKLVIKPDSRAEKIEAGSLLWFFRQMEVETGFFFSSRAMQALIEHYERDSLETGHSSLDRLLKYRNASELIADIQHLPLQLPKSQQQYESLPETLAALQPEAALLPRAAKDLRNKVNGLRFILDDARIKDVETMEVIVSHQECHGGMLHVSGQIPGVDEDAMTFLFFWCCNSQLINPIPGESGCRENVFWAVFPTEECENPMQGKLIVRILIEK